MSNNRISFWEFFQSLGKTFMLPVALLSFCGIMLGIGSSLASQDVRTLLPILDNNFCIIFFTWMSKVGSFAFSFLPAMFAIAIPLGLAREDKGVAAFSGFVGYTILNLSINFYLNITGILPNENAELLKAYDIQNVFGIQSINTGILGAIIVGIIVYALHERFRTIKLHDAFAFFGGNRFVPIITTITLGILGLIVPIVWPYFASAIKGLGNIIHSSGVFAPMLFGSGERLLLPFGLHHILVALVRFTEAGGTMNVCGQPISGALTIFQAQLSCPTVTNFSVSATQFLSQGKMPSFLGGLPGAALAMFVCAKPENKSHVKGLLISGIIACVVGGITEPLEFLFLFVSPLLYFIHAILTGLGFMIVAILGVTIGNTDGNLIDFVVFGILHGTATKWYLIPIISSIWFVIYFSIFKTIIIKFNIQTPGREIESSKTESDVKTQSKSGYNVVAILEALGGKENIVSLDNCITRLRLSVNDISLINDAKLKANKAIGVVKLNDTNLQVVIGPQVQSVKDELAELIKS